MTLEELDKHYKKYSCKKCNNALLDKKYDVIKCKINNCHNYIYPSNSCVSCADFQKRIDKQKTFNLFGECKV